MGRSGPRSTAALHEAAVRRPVRDGRQDGFGDRTRRREWTRYLLGFDKLYVVDFHQELLDEFARNVTADNVIRVRNNGTDFPGVPERSIDYVFSFGTFVHLNAHVIEQYLANMRAILAPRSSVVLHYSDKNKVMARENIGFAEMDPERMRQLVTGAGYRIVEEDTTSMWHSAVIRFTVEEHVH